MIVRCPKCRVRYRLEDTRIRSESARLRCPKCDAVFIARKDADRADSSGTTVPSASPSPARSAHPEGTKVRRSALLADEPREFRDFVEQVLREAQVEVGLTDNGEEALLLAGAHRFDLILLNVYLRRMLGINVCERPKSDPDTSDIPVVLIGAQVRPEEGGLPPGLYGADAFLPTSIGRREIIERLRRFMPELPSLPEAGGAETARDVAATSTREEGEIRRLARIMVSDIQMYHPEKFNRALREGTFFESFAEELGKGKEILDQRFGKCAARVQILAAGLRDTLSGLRPSSGPRKASGE